jgi:murein DD-endopeptidase MepM/ murein hydrolase activator NlpD
MSGVVALLRSRQLSHVAVLALVSFGFAGCSADTSRFAENPFASSSGPRPPEVTGSVQQPYYSGQPHSSAAPVPRVESRPMPSYQSSALPPPTVPAQNYNYAQPTSGGGRGVASYAPPAQPIETTSTVAPRSVAAVNNYSRDGGTPVIVGTSDTLDGLARRYNVPASAIMQANGMSGPRMLQPGQRLIIPRRAATASAPAMSQPPAMASAPPTRPAAPAAGANVHIVNRGDTLASIARRNKISTERLARANGLDSSSPLKLGSKVMIPSAQVATTAPAAQPAVAAPAKPQEVATAQPAPVAVTTVGQPQKIRKASETAEVESEAKKDVTTSGLPTFRWPVRGRVIASYGAKTNGKNNDGINVAVPEGTPVKAAEDGVVTYAGNELKGYGNLVLVRHSNGYVTAYAHTSELMVKRGDTIRRGQTIAKSGQTGEVGSPQLHFEIRKGSTPVDPNQFLNGT